MAKKNRGIVQSSREEHRNLMRKDGEEVAKKERTTFENWQKQVFDFLENPMTKIAVSYHVVNLSLIVGSILTSVLSTVQSLENNHSFRKFILYYELALLTWFTVEYILRVWGCSVVKKYEGIRGRLLFMKTFYMLVDAFVIVSTITTAVLHLKHTYFTILRITRFLQVFRILRWDRQRGDLNTMGRVVYKHRKELITCYFVGFIILFGGTYIVYIVEKSASNATIDNMANGLYWAMITVTSVGYGDISPITWPGKICTGIFALVGCAFFALPAGILGSGFALQVAKQKKLQRYTKVRNPAAIVIQSLWRNHAVKQNKYQLQATWNFMFPQVLKSTAWPGYYGLLPGVIAIHDSIAFEKFRASVGREKTTTNKKKKKRRCMREFNCLKSNSPEVSDEGSVPRVSGNRKISIIKDLTPKKQPKKSLPLSQLINDRYKIAIRFILRVKYFSCIRIFKQARYPFVQVQDIMEKNAHDHIETLAYLREMKESIEQFRKELLEMKNNFRDYRFPDETEDTEDTEDEEYEYEKDEEDEEEDVVRVNVGNIKLEDQHYLRNNTINEDDVFEAPTLAESAV